MIELESKCSAVTVWYVLQQYLAYSCGLVRGALSNLGMDCVVTAEVSLMPSCESLIIIIIYHIPSYHTKHYRYYRDVSNQRLFSLLSSQTHPLLGFISLQKHYLASRQLLKELNVSLLRSRESNKITQFHICHKQLYYKGVLY